MSRHIQFVNAMMKQIRDPSPEVAAYIRQYQANVPILTNDNASDEDKEAALDASISRFYRCTKAEQQQLISIQKEH